MSEFKDLFSGQAAQYSQYRPQYPPQLFEWVAGLVPRHRLAWDCATGSGQAATGLAAYFDNVVATDASEKQIGSAALHPGVEYRIATAHESGLDDNSVDLIANYASKHGGDPVAPVEAALGEHWGPPDNRHLIQWPLHIRAGYF